MIDDRDAFAREQRENARRLAADADLARRALEVTAAADRHHYPYLWNWLGLPVIQMPADIIALQEIIWQCAPQVVVETGIARGGSVILYASVLELLGEGRVIGVDIEIRPHNRAAIESHPLGRRVTMVEGSSVDPEVVERVRQEIGAAERVMVVLDSDHTHDHVLRELTLYAPLVTDGQYLVVCDTVVEDLPRQEHRPRRWGPGDNPRTALDRFLEDTDRFEPDAYVNGKLLLSNSAGGYLRCVKR